MALAARGTVLLINLLLYNTLYFVVSMSMDNMKPHNIPVDSVLSLFEKNPITNSNMASTQAPGGDISTDDVVEDSYKLRMTRDTMQHYHKRRTSNVRVRRGRFLSSIQNKSWWPFKKRRNRFMEFDIDGYCEEYCACRHYHDHHRKEGYFPPVPVPWENYLRPVRSNHYHNNPYNNYQKVLPYQYDSGRSEYYSDDIDDDGSNFEHQLFHEKREIGLLKERIRLKEELQRLRNKERRREIHHHHGVSHLHNGVRDGSSESSEEDNKNTEYLEKKKKISKDKNEAAKAKLLSALLLQMGGDQAKPIGGMKPGPSAMNFNEAGGMMGGEMTQNAMSGMQMLQGAMPGVKPQTPMPEGMSQTAMAMGMQQITMPIGMPQTTMPMGMPQTAMPMGMPQTAMPIGVPQTGRPMGMPPQDSMAVMMVGGGEMQQGAMNGGLPETQMPMGMSQGPMTGMMPIRMLQFAMNGEKPQGAMTQGMNGGAFSILGPSVSSSLPSKMSSTAQLAAELLLNNVDDDPDERNVSKEIRDLKK